MSTLPPHVQERLLAFGTLPGKFIPPARRLGEGWNPSALHTPQTVTMYRKASAHTVARRTLYRRRRPPSSLSKSFRASSYRRRRSLFAEAIEPSVNGVLRLEPAAGVKHGREGRPTKRRRVASSSQSRRRQQVDQRGHPWQRFAPPRAGVKTGGSPRRRRDCSRARRPPVASGAGDAVRSCPTRFGHRSARTGYAHVRPAWYRSARKRTGVKYCV